MEEETGIAISWRMSNRSDLFFFSLQLRLCSVTFASLAVVQLADSARRFIHAPEDLMRYTVAVLVGLVFHAHASAQVVQFTNGNFETGDFTGWTVGVTSGGATAQQIVTTFDIDGPGPLGDSLTAQFSAGRATGVTTGEHGVTLTQTLALSAGVMYTFDFDWAAHRSPGQAANSQGGIFALMVDSTEITRQAAGSTGSATPRFGHVVGNFTPVADGNYAVGVWILRPFTIPTPATPTLFQSVDNFAVTTIPEPSSIGLMTVGALVMAKRWRKGKRV